MTFEPQTITFRVTVEPVATRKFRLGIATATGWRHVPVDIDVPSEIFLIEDFLRCFGYLPEGNKGKLKSFWEATVRRLKAEHACGDATVVCSPA